MINSTAPVETSNVVARRPLRRIAGGGYLRVFSAKDSPNMNHQCVNPFDILLPINSLSCDTLRKVRMILVSTRGGITARRLTYDKDAQKSPCGFPES